MTFELGFMISTFEQLFDLNEIKKFKIVKLCLYSIEYLIEEKLKEISYLVWF